MDIKPNCTLYINHLNEKINKEELKKSLYFMFSQYGIILDIVAMKTMKMRGQAFVVFQDIPSASTALRAMQGFPFYSKPMKLGYAKSESHVVARRKKSYEEDKKAAAASTSKKPDVVAIPSGPKKKKEDVVPITNGVVSPPVAAAAGAVVSREPANTILFISNLPPESTDMMLAMLFKQFPGYKEARQVPGRSGIAFIEFESVSQSAAARDALQGFKISPSHAMKISYAKKG